MESASHVKRILEEHCYACPYVCSASSLAESTSPTSQSSSKTSNFVKDKLPRSKARKGVLGFEFIDVSDIGNARESLEECMVSLHKDFRVEDSKGVAVDPLTEEELVPKKLLSECQTEYKKKIETLQIFITNIMKATEQDALILRVEFLEEKIEALETRLKEKEPQLQAEIDLKTNNTGEKGYKHLMNQLLSLEMENKDLNQQLNIAIQEKQLLEDRLEIRLKTSKMDNENLNRTLTTVVQQKNDLNNRLKEFRDKLEAKESELRQSELRCSVLTRELESCTKKYIAHSMELSKERLDMDVIQNWLTETSGCQRDLKKQLAVLNEYLRYLGEAQQTCEKKISGTPKRWPQRNHQRTEKKTRHFYVMEREKLLEDHENKSREIGLELDVMKENVLMLRNVLAQKDEHCNFLEEESKLLREELRLKEVKEENVKDEGDGEGSVGISTQLCD